MHTSGKGEAYDSVREPHQIGASYWGGHPMARPLGSLPRMSVRSVRLLFQSSQRLNEVLFTLPLLIQIVCPPYIEA